MYKRLIALFLTFALVLPFRPDTQITASALNQSPSLIQLWPEEGVELGPKEPITLTFDQPMDRAHTESAVKFAPATAGTFAWSDAQTLAFTPNSPWLDKTQLTVQQNARAITGLTMSSDASFTLRTDAVSAFSVIGMVPQNAATGAALDSKIAMSFDRPVVPLMPAEDANGQPAPFTITPALKGTGHWSDTATYVFTPAAPMVGGVKYTVTVPARFKAVDGSALAQPYVSTFVTMYPEVTEIAASGNDLVDCSDRYLVGLGCSVTVSFSEAVDSASALAAFSLTEKGTGKVIQGKATLSADGKKLTFKPAARFAYNTTYEATVLNSTLNRARTATIARTETVDLDTIFGPSIENIDDNSSTSDTGIVQFDFNSPMISATVKSRIVISPTPKDLNIRIGYDNDPVKDKLARVFVVTFTREPGVQYEAKLLAGAADVYGTPMTTDNSLKLKVYASADANPNEVYPVLNGSIMMIDAKDAHYSVMAQGQTTVSSDLYQVTPDIFKQYGLTNVQYGEDCTNSLAGYGDSPINLALPTLQTPLRSWQQSFDDARGTTTRHEIALSATSKSIAPGMYMVHMTGPYRNFDGSTTATSDFVLIAATASLTVKSTDKEMFVWVTDLETAQPLSGVPVTLYYNGVAHALGKTDDQGIARGPLTFTDRRQDEFDGHSTQVYVVAQAPGIYGAWYSCYPTWEIQRTRKDFLYTDRPIYRPGETVNVKGILRNRNDMDFTPANLKTVTLTLANTQQSLESVTATVNSDGTYTAAFKLPDDTALGDATISVDDPTAGTTDDHGLDTSACPYTDYYYYNDACSYTVSFNVADFRPPEIQVGVSTDQHEIIQGDPLNFDVAATYYSGGVVGNTTFNWRIYGTPTYFNYTGSGDYQFGDERWYNNFYYYDSGYDGQTQDEGTDTTDDNGKQRVQSTKTVLENPDSNTNDELAPGSPPVEYTGEATVTDGSAQPVSAHTTPILAHPSTVYIGINGKEWGVGAGLSTPLNFITVHPDSTIAAHQSITYKIARVTWVTVRDADFNNVSWKEKIDVVRSGVLTTGTDGTATQAFTPDKPGVYRVEVITKDAQGRVANATLRMYVTDKAFSDDIFWQAPDSAMTPVADKKSYKPGETAQIEVPTGFEESSVMLVTVERGSILWSNVVKLDDAAPTYKLPILDNFAPGVIVNFTVYRGGKPDYRYGQLQLNVEPVAKRLNIQLTPSTNTAAPHGTVSFDVLVTDYQNKPVQADVSLALVDKSVLALVDPNTPTLEEYYYGGSVENYVQTTLSQFGYMPLLEDAYIVPCCFGGGGGGGGRGLSPVYIRNNFKYTALWSPFVTTDSNGKASVQVTLPNNATTWILDARAVTATTQVGQGTTEMLATLPLLIRPVTPRFMVAGDTVQLSAIVNNNSGKDETATVKLDTAGVKVTSPLEQKVHVTAGQHVRVIWNASVTDAASADLTFTVISNDGLSDASKPTLSISGDGTIPIYQYVAYDDVATSGALLQPGSQANKIIIPPHYTNVSGQATVSLQSSLAAVSLNSLDYLQSFPHDCIEQTVSKFLPNAVTLNALKTLNLSKPDLEQQLTQAINAAELKLQQAQNSDGGWGWFPNMPTDPLVTAYAILGSAISGDKDFSLDDAISRLQKEVVQPDVNTSGWMLNRQAFYLYVLAEAYKADPTSYPDDARQALPNDLAALFAYRDKLDYAGRAYLLMAYQYTDSRVDAVQRLVDDLISASHRSATTAYWTEPSEDIWNWGSDTRTAALAIKAILQTRPTDPILPLAVRWLVGVRQADHWETTQETAWAVMALTDWMVSTQELNGNYGYDVKLGDTTLMSGAVKSGDIGDINKLQIDIQKIISAPGDLLQVDRGAGDGALYYMTNLQLYSSATQARAIDRGVSVKREYLVNGRPMTQVQVGDVINVKLTFTVEQDMHYFVLEDPYPAGIEAVDPGLRTASLDAQDPTLSQVWDGQEYSGWGWWYIDRVDLRDQQMNLYADYLPQGTYTFTYQVRATFAGKFQVMPAHAYPFYQPDQFGRSTGVVLTISDESF